MNDVLALLRRCEMRIYILSSTLF